ncbi:RIP metalloprotease RseP [Meridianimarinicoccus roseus]|uniref:Zinc metalloprotease n=1 Tax=Meridianimarinicoccus roseus TaxID=2072018 RepID=A0A2V2LIC4_9RHOB|nr:RIP metalloprotease RseP [Meridianimarinicoccus roseus]PWR03314.1 RIP metalloprotease RseP [Meridianimarinicoccus roseus]
MEILGLIPSFGGLAYTIGAFVVALSVIVAIHEYGHYIVGRWCGIHAEVFSLGFGPQLFSWRDRRGTLWQVAALPLGGYVKFLGDADAASAADGAAIARMDPAMRRRTMHAAPLWARAATVAAGPVFNFLLSILVFAAVVMWQGQAQEPLTIDEISPMPQAVQTLEPGDRILEIHGRTVPSFDAFSGFVENLPRAPELDYTVSRDGREITVPGPYPYPPLVSGVAPQSAAMDAGLQEGDVITHVGGTRISSFEDLRSAVMVSDGAPIDLTVWRDGDSFALSLTPRSADVPLPDGGFEKRFLIGVTGGLFFAPVTETPGPLEALGIGLDQTGYIITQSLSGLYHMITGAISTCNLSGPVGIAETSGAAASQGLASFVWFIAVLSTAVGLMNLFPVPVLDGGHLVFHAYEAVTGRPPSDRALQVLMAGGLALIITLMLFAVTNDLFCP